MFSLQVLLCANMLVIQPYRICRATGEAALLAEAIDAVPVDEVSVIAHYFEPPLYELLQLCCIHCALYDTVECSPVLLLSHNNTSFSACSRAICVLFDQTASSTSHQHYAQTVYSPTQTTLQHVLTTLATYMRTHYCISAGTTSSTSCSRSTGVTAAQYTCWPAREWTCHRVSLNVGA
jgi:hypothetical protein